MEINCKQMLIGGGKTTTPKVRDERIDSVKYWLMILVITGHVIQRQNFPDNSFVITVRQWIYLFHMPLFIFLSGYFSHKKNEKDFLANIWKLLEPLIIFQIILKVPEIFKGSMSLSSCLTPEWVLWYLLSLIYWRLMIQFIPDKFLNNVKLILSVTLCISIIAGFLPFDKFLSIQRTLSFMPFFFLGYCMKGYNLFLPKKYKLLSLFFLLLTILIPFLFPQYLGDLSHSKPYEQYYMAFSRLLAFGLSIPMSIAFINICPNISWIARQGRLTLQYYIYHALIITILMLIVNKLNIPNTPLSSVVYTMMIAAIIGFASHLPNFTKFTNPSSFFKK